MKANTAGFTLIELMFTIAVAAVLLAVGVPNFRDFVRNSRMAGAANDIITDFNLARSEAIKRGVPVTLCKSQDGATCADAADPFNRWIVFVDDADPAVRVAADGNGDIDADEVILRQRTIADTITVTTNADAQGSTFLPNGFRNTNIPGVVAVTAMQLCDVRGNVVAVGGESAARLIQITATGRPAVTRNIATIGDCP